MQSLYGIPIYNMANYYTYFADLANTEHNSEIVGILKQNLLESAQADINSTVNNLKLPETIKQAVDFINMVATHERHKEMQVIQQYCRKQKKKYPFLNISEKDILNDPYNFYLQLTNYLNKAQQTAITYRQELQRIRLNAGVIDSALKKHNRSEYSAQDFRYNMQSDLKSLLTKLIGTFRAKKVSPDAYTTQVQKSVIEILSEFDLPQKLADGIEFAALASGVFMELQNQLQSKFDKIMEEDYKNQETMAKVIRHAIDEVTKKYINQIKSGKDLSAIQEALINLQSPRSQFALNQIAKGLGLSYLTKTADITNQLAKRRKAMDAGRKIAGYKEMMQAIKNNINYNLNQSLRRLTFTEFNANTGHGNIYEVIKSSLHSNKNRGLFISGMGATDIMRLNIGYDLDDKTDSVLNEILEGLDNILSSHEFETPLDDAGNLQLKAHEINEALIKAEKQIDELLHNIDSEEKIFIFHDSLKLQSSVETGKSLGFEGRNINLISAVDDIINAMNSVMPTTFIEKNQLINLILNLSPEAASTSSNSDTNINILEQYLAKFAGMLMFSDTEQMAREAVTEIQQSANGVSYSTIENIHLYLLNGVYVPASFILTYISDNIKEAYKYAAEDIAKVTINIKSATNTITNWLKNYKEGQIKYSLDEWKKVAAKVSAGSTIKITFLRAFINFINDLFDSL